MTLLKRILGFGLLVLVSALLLRWGLMTPYHRGAVPLPGPMPVYRLPAAPPPADSLTRYDSLPQPRVPGLPPMTPH